ASARIRPSTHGTSWRCGTVLESSRRRISRARRTPPTQHGSLASPRTLRVCPGRLADRPGVAGVEELAQVAFALLLLCRRDLLGHQLVVDRTFDVAEDADRSRALRRVRDAREREGQRRCNMVLVVDE